MENIWLTVEIKKREKEITTLEKSLESLYMNRSKANQMIENLERELIGKSGELRALEQVLKQDEGVKDA